MAKKNTTEEIIIENELTVYNINDIYRKIKSTAKKHENIHIELKNIRQIDVAGIQLIKAVKNMENNNISVNCILEEKMEQLLKKTSLKETLIN